MDTRILPSVIDMTNYCEDKGYEIIPIGKGKIVKVVIFLNNKLIKEGNKTYTISNWQKEAYKKLYEALNN